MPTMPTMPTMPAMPTMLTMRCYGRRLGLTLAAPILAMRSWCWQRMEDMRAGVHQKLYMSLEVEVAGTALVGGTWASIRPTPASKCMVQTTTGGANAEAMPTRSQGGVGGGGGYGARRI